jgi:hypothetical protein
MGEAQAFTTFYSRLGRSFFNSCIIFHTLDGIRHLTWFHFFPIVNAVYERIFLKGKAVKRETVNF